MLSSWRNLSARDRREAIEGYISISPWLIGFLALTLGPILASVYYSFTQWTITSPPIWIGVENYVRMFTRDPLFWQALKVTLLYVVYSLPLKITFGLGLALLLNMKLRGMDDFPTVFYIPAVFSGVRSR